MTEKSLAISEFQQVILEQYRKNARTLPWRETKDPYKILVSELMLQQTQVARVIPKYVNFLALFPTPRALYDAPLADVLRAWQGLGYNRRAKYLQQVAELFLRSPKPSYEQLLEQKGIGEYTAAAVCAFAYNQDTLAIDVNVRRVFTRFFGKVDDAFIANALPRGKSREWHNALMDFGARVCTKRSPSCSQCPLATSCFALKNNTFAIEKSAAQPKFQGSIRWHRGAVLGAALKHPVHPHDFMASLDARYADTKKLAAAVKGLTAEGLLIQNHSGMLVPKN